ITSIQIPVPLTQGGTGQITNTAAFNALAPCSTQGDVLYNNGTNWVCLATGTSGQFLKTLGAAANPAWAPPPAYQWYFAGGGSAAHAPADSTTYYRVDGSALGAPSSGTETSFQQKVPFACTIRAVQGTVTVAGTLGSGEDTPFSIRINNTTDTSIQSNVH